jgi:ABC-type sugar transport system ATPase subunit
MSDIRIEKLRKEYGSTIAVNDVTITFQSGSVTCLLGPSGCGKTTLLRMIAGLEEPTSGEIYFGDQKVTDLAPSQRNIGMVFQYPVVYRGITVYQNIELPLLQEKLTDLERKQRVMSVIETLGLEDSMNKDITRLDNGTRQKVAVARTVARQPQIILFDEPITNVDIASKDQLKESLKNLTRILKQTIVYVTHDQTEAMTLADQIALMNDGVVVQRDKPRSLYSKPNDVFGGWFLGNPGMDFFDLPVKPNGAGCEVQSSLFPRPLQVEGLSDASFIKLGIRPELIKVSDEKSGDLVPGKITRKSIVVGGQYLLTIKAGDHTFKVKVDHESGYKLKEDIYFALPLKDITIFGENGHRLAVNFSMAK